jgi:hypothetical protein
MSLIPTNTFFEGIPYVAIDFAVFMAQTAVKQTLSLELAVTARGAILELGEHHQLDWLTVVQAWDAIPELQPFALAVRQTFLPIG